MITICYALVEVVSLSGTAKRLFHPEDGRGGILVSKNGICAGFLFLITLKSFDRIL
jgi:hypothetical protein